jgi:bifunctional UDP-N-acetylglucosamine pyrophosphorylase/glucosamine-1-phosphate N-acetyltransferase
MNVILMCGGLSKRFLDEKNNNVCKITYKISEKPMIIHILDTIQQIDINNKIYIVLSVKYGDQIIECINKHITNTGNIIYTYQDIYRNGTGGAIHSCLNYLKNSHYNNTLILSGDVPYISKETIENILKYKNCLMITTLDEPLGNGRILFENNNIVKIIEEKDCNYDEKKIKFINTGNYFFETKNILDLIPLITNDNKANEYYLTDIVNLLYQYKIKLNYYELSKEKQYEIYNINTLQDLQNAEKIYKIYI